MSQILTKLRMLTLVFSVQYINCKLISGVLHAKNYEMVSNYTSGGLWINFDHLGLFNTHNAWYTSLFAFCYQNVATAANIESVSSSSAVKRHSYHTATAADFCTLGLQN